MGGDFGEGVAGHQTEIEAGTARGQGLQNSIIRIRPIVALNSDALNAWRFMDNGSLYPESGNFIKAY